MAWSMPYQNKQSLVCVLKQSIESSERARFVSSFIPLPLKLFSLIPTAKVEPSVPTPADAEISPVGFSSIIISMIFLLLSTVSLIFDLLLQRFLDFRLFIDRVWRILLNGSPSSTIKLSLINSSDVILFPNILILST